MSNFGLMGAELATNLTQVRDMGFVKEVASRTAGESRLEMCIQRWSCAAACPAGAQCIGCYGPAEGVVDYGARLISSFASVLESNDPAEIDKTLDGLVDPAGQFYRFNLAGSLLKAAVPAWKKEKA